MASHPRLFYNNDGSHLIYLPPPVSLDAFVYETVGYLFGTQVDAVVCHMFGFGDAIPLFPTEVPEAKGIELDQVEWVSEWRQQEIMRLLFDQGIDPWKASLEAAHEAGMEFWAGLRFNDLHGGRFQWKSEFRVNHPEYELGNQCPAGSHQSDPERPCHGLNFAVPEVRVHRLAQVEEVCTRYDVDGFEWDLNRHPGHHFPDMEAGAPMLTAYIREAKEMLNGVGDRRGRPVKFSVRVPGTVEACHRIAVEIETWIREGLVDYVSPSAYHDTSTDLPFDHFVALADGKDVRIYASPGEMVGPGLHWPPPIETLRAGAFNAWQQGVDGVYIFNYNHPIVSDMDMSGLFRELGSPATLEWRDKRYTVAGGHSELRGDSYGFKSWKHQLPAALEEQPTGPGHTVRFLVGDDLRTAAERGVLDAVTLELIVIGQTYEDVVEFKLNGKPLPEGPQFRMYQKYKMGPGANAFQGRYALRYDLRSGDWIRPGWNEVELALRKRTRRVRQPFEVYELNLEVKYRVLPIRP